MPDLALPVPTDRPSRLTTEMSEIEELRQELARLRGCLVERDREAEQRELQLRASYEATRTKIVKVIIEAVCIDDKDVPHPASQVRE